MQDSDCVPRQDLLNVKLTLAAERGDAGEMKALIVAGANVNTSDASFGSPLMSAVDSGTLEAIKLLLDKGANVNAVNAQGYTPLMNAVLSGNPDVVRLLLSRAADVNAETYPLIHGKRTDKFTALLLAEGKKNEAIIKLLKDAGAK